MDGKYLFANIDTTAKIINSVVDRKNVRVWSSARVQDSDLQENNSIGNDSIIVKSNLGENCNIGRRNIISNSNVGKGSSTQGNTTIRFSSVGKYCAIAWNVTVGAPNHDIHRIAMVELDYIYEDEEHEHLSSFDDLSCIIGNDVWIAAGAHVLRGVKISDGAVVAANAVVTKDVPAYAIVAGVPAKIIGYRFNEEQIKKLLDICWWDFSKEQLVKARELFSQDLTDEILEKLYSIKNVGKTERGTIWN